MFENLANFHSHLPKIATDHLALRTPSQLVQYLYRLLIYFEISMCRGRLGVKIFLIYIFNFF